MDGCPICSNKLTHYVYSRKESQYKNHFRVICEKNKCFDYTFDYGEVIVYIFKERFEYDSDEISFSKEVIDKVNYWKEDYRFLTKIL